MTNSNLVIYHYFEKDASYRDNFLHFLVFGVQAGVDCVVIISGQHSLDLPTLDNMRYVFTPAKNSDFGGYAHLINEGLDFSPYDNIFFINSSVRGPFVPPYHSRPWFESFLAQMHSDVGMVGVSICILKEDFRHSINYQARYGGNSPYSHVQTMAYVLRKEVLAKLVNDGFYRENRDATKTLAIEDYEIHLSQLVLKQGWNIACLLPELNTIDYRLPHANPNPTSTMGDPNEVLGYFGRSVHPYEVLFIKTNRHLYTEAYLARLTYSMWQARATAITPSLLVNRAISDYLQRMSQAALSGEVVTDFSYLPGAIELQSELALVRKEAEQAQEQWAQMRQSSSWKITAPLRALKDWISGAQR